MEENKETVEKNIKQEGTVKTDWWNGIYKIICILIIGASLVACTVIFTKGFVGYKVKSLGGGFSATGSASRDFEADLIVWRGSFSEYDRTMQSSFDRIKRDSEAIRKYLLDNGVKEDELVFSSIEINRRYESIYNDEGNCVGNEFAGYELYQTVTVTSSNIDNVEKISRDITELIETGIEFSSNSPEYYFTKLDELKLELIEAATENAKERIELMAEGSGSEVNELISSNLGVFQITAKNSGSEEYSYGGNFNISSREKTASITVRLNYSAK